MLGYHLILRHLCVISNTKSFLLGHNYLKSTVGMSLQLNLKQVFL